MPLPQETLNIVKENITEADKAIKALEPEISRAKAAGLDVSAQEKQLNYYKTQLQNLRSQYARG